MIILSTIAQPIDQMAIAVVDLLMTLIKGQVHHVKGCEGGTNAKN